MREIKFRVWNAASKIMVFPGWKELADRAILAEMKLMQFTGLKDNNGKEIYEGDILQQGEGEHETLIEVRFGDGTFDSGYYHFTGFYGIYLKIGFGGGFSAGDLCEDMDEITKEECGRREVIGNIYETPGLCDVLHEGGEN